MRVHFKLFIFLFIFLFLASVSSCNRKPPSLEALDYIDRRSNLPIVEPIQRDIAQIRQRGTLTVVAPYNSTTYFIYQGEPLGYEYELLQAFAKDLNVALKIVVVTDPKSLLSALNEGEGDIAAARLIPNADNQSVAAFTNALYRTDPVLVQQDEPPSQAGKGTSSPFRPKRRAIRLIITNS